MWQLHRLPSNSIASKVRRSGRAQTRKELEEREKRQNLKGAAAPKGQQADYGRVSIRIPLYCCAMLCSLSGLCSLLRYGYTPMRCRSEPV